VCGGKPSRGGRFGEVESARLWGKLGRVVGVRESDARVQE